MTIRERAQETANEIVGMLNMLKLWDMGRTYIYGEIDNAIINMKRNGFDISYTGRAAINPIQADEMYRLSLKVSGRYYSMSYEIENHYDYDPDFMNDNGETDGDRVARYERIGECFERVAGYMKNVRDYLND